MKGAVVCPSCGKQFVIHNYPIPTVDILISREKDGKRAVILIRRKNPPHGWAIPGGFLEYGERAEDGAVREAKEETVLDVTLTGLLGVYSDPGRDSRFHTISTVYTAEAEGEPRADSDAAGIGIFTEDELPPDIAFDHREILKDYFDARHQAGMPKADRAR
ncbi:MAG: NUDIX hydrolase [Candidatus Aureabacteria bacterium]|nr:NUDIX hydrolase [Candidatus Auribacterota bacterium]